MGYVDFLNLVLSEELGVRDDYRFRQVLRLPKLPRHKALDEYDFAFQPELEPHKVKDLAALSFVEAKANAAPLGPPGAGKTHIADTLAVATAGLATQTFGEQPSGGASSPHNPVVREYLPRPRWLPNLPEREHLHACPIRHTWFRQGRKAR